MYESCQRFMYRSRLGRVPELLINSEKASTSHVFNEYIERFLRFRFSMIQTHDPILTCHRKIEFSIGNSFSNDSIFILSYSFNWQVALGFELPFAREVFLYRTMQMS